MSNTECKIFYRTSPLDLIIDDIGDSKIKQKHINKWLASGKCIHPKVRNGRRTCDHFMLRVGSTTSTGLHDYTSQCPVALKARASNRTGS